MNDLVKRFGCVAAVIFAVCLAPRAKAGWTDAINPASHVKAIVHAVQDPTPGNVAKAVSPGVNQAANIADATGASKKAAVIANLPDKAAATMDAVTKTANATRMDVVATSDSARSFVESIRFPAQLLVYSLVGVVLLKGVLMVAGRRSEPATA